MWHRQRRFPLSLAENSLHTVKACIMTPNRAAISIRRDRSTGRNASNTRLGRLVHSRSPQGATSFRPPSRALTPHSNQKSLLICPLTERFYRLRCKDLGIPVLADQQARFLLQVKKFKANRKVELSDSGLGAASAEALGKLIKKNSDFAYVQVAKNELADRGSCALVKEIKGSTSIVHLNVSSNGISPEGFVEMLKDLEKHPSLCSLNIGSEGMKRNKLKEKGAESVKNLLLVNQILSVLNLSGTSIGPGGVKLICSGIKFNRSIVSLDLSVNKIGSAPIKGLCRALSQSRVEDINLAENLIQNCACEELCKFVAGEFGNCPVSRLNLSKNSIGTKGAESIFSGLTVNRTVTHLKLNDNSLSGGASDAFYDFLYRNRTVSYLDLANCELELEGFRRINEPLVANDSLKHLNMRNNRLNHCCVEFIALGLKLNKGIKYLNLSNNDIDNCSGLLLFKALELNTALEQLIMDNNRLKDTPGNILIENIRKNKKLQVVSLHKNDLRMRTQEQIEEILQINQKEQERNMIIELKKNCKKLFIIPDKLDFVNSTIKSKQREKKGREENYKTKCTFYHELKLKTDNKFNELKEKLQEKVQENDDLDQILAEIQENSHHEEGKYKRLIEELERKCHTINDELDSKDLFFRKQSTLIQSLKLLREDFHKEKLKNKRARSSLMTLKRQLKILKPSPNKFLASPELTSTVTQRRPFSFD